jgi:hypothetical protein
MLEKQSSPHVPSVVTPIESEFLLDETDASVFEFQEQAFAVLDLSMSSGMKALWLMGRREILNQNTDSGSVSLVVAVKNLIDVVGKSETLPSSLLTEMDYQGLVTILDDLIDVVGENENHILASLMDFIGTLIESYEDEHVPELTST